MGELATAAGMGGVQAFGRVPVDQAVKVTFTLTHEDGTVMQTKTQEFGGDGSDRPQAEVELGEYRDSATFEALSQQLQLLGGQLAAETDPGEFITVTREIVGELSTVEVLAEKVHPLNDS